MVRYELAAQQQTAQVSTLAQWCRQVPCHGFSEQTELVHQEQVDLKKVV